MIKQLVWRTIKTAPRKEFLEVDLWLYIYPSPRSMGMSDRFRVTNAFRKNGGWYHRDKGEEKEIYSDYITHWMPIPKPPK